MRRSWMLRLADAYTSHQALERSRLRVVSELQNARPGNFWYATVVRHKSTAAGPYRCDELKRVRNFDAGRGA